MVLEAKVAIVGHKPVAECAVRTSANAIARSRRCGSVANLLAADAHEMVVVNCEPGRFGAAVA